MLRNAFSGTFSGLHLAEPLTPAWRAAIFRLGLIWAFLIAAFASDWVAMAAQWWNSSSYNHILLIPAILAWLVWQRFGELMRIEPSMWWPGLLAVAGAAFIWLLGTFGGLATASQLGAVALLVAATITFIGVRASAALAFPLGYMFLLVPIGDELVPGLQMVTASIAIWLVELSGIPAVIDGVFISTPVALFEVAEACSGVRFLVAMVAFGVLVANVCFTSWTRRLVFLGACVVVPILANGVRAWGTIYAAQFVGVELATGVDHIVYGWIFFAIVMALVILGAWRFFDRQPGDPMIDAGRINSSPLLGRLETMRVSAVPAIVLLAAITIGSQAWSRAADQLVAPMPERIGLPEVPGWHRADYVPSVWWEPRADGAEHRLLGRYADDAGHEVDVFLALYSAQGEGREAGGFGQGALPPESAWSWQSPGPDFGEAKSDRLLAQGSTERVAFTWYRTGELITGSNARLKLANMGDRLLLRRNPTTVLILSAVEREGKPAVEAIEAFRRAAGPLDQWMDRVAAVR
ncbi:MAG: exosortase A [Novosphingobium sp.]|nr:exosortase A [Novosphingobium sp.]MCP5402429.1 exosortase A [Novosphingobium sp.]